jgi:hypothetical protein
MAGRVDALRPAVTMLLWLPMVVIALNTALVIASLKGRRRCKEILSTLKVCDEIEELERISQL